MAAKTEASRSHRPQQSQPPPQHGKLQQKRPSKPQVYTLYPDPPIRQPSAPQLPPSPSQLLSKNRQDQKSKASHSDLTTQSSFSSTKSSSHTASAQAKAQPTVSTREGSKQNSKQQNQQQSSPQPHPSQQQQQQAYSSLKNVLPSPISPSSPASKVFVTVNKGNTRVIDDKSLLSPQSDRAPMRAGAGSDGVRNDRQAVSSKTTAQREVSSTSTPLGLYASSPPSRQHGLQLHPTYGGSVPRQSVQKPSPAEQNQGQEHGRAQGQVAALKQSTFPGSSSTPSGSSQHQNGLKQNGSTPSTSPRHGPSATTTTVSSPTRSDRPSIITDIPSSSLSLSFDRNTGQDQPTQNSQEYEKQALQYQQKLRQKPPKQGEDTDEDSDSGSIVSYRRSIHRLSMTYMGRAGVANITPFASHQRPQIVQYDRSAAGSIAVSGVKTVAKEQKDEGQSSQQHKQQQQQQQQSPTSKESSSLHYQQQGNVKSGSNYGSGSSLATTDQGHRYHDSRSRQDDAGRPRPVRANTTNDPPVSRSKETMAPERSISADNVYHQNSGAGRSQQRMDGSQQQHQKSKYQHHGQLQQQPQHWKEHPYPSNYLPTPANTSSSAGSQSAAQQRGQHEPRPSHESAQSMRSQYSRHRPDAQQGRNGGSVPGSDPNRSKSPSRAGALSPSGSLLRGGLSHHPLPTTARGGAGLGNNSNNKNSPLNMHPAHHFPSGGYVRPEEAFSPSNPMPEQAEDYVRQGIEFHEIGEISKATHYFRTAAEIGDPVGMLMYGLSVRHGWGCTANRVLAFQYLQKSAEHAVGDLNSRDSFTSSAAKGELVLAIYELGICFRHGWGVDKNKKTAAYYFEIAANLGDPDAQNDLAWCYYHGIGVKKDMYKSAKYYRMAAAQGLETMGNSWIWKDKYGGPTSPAPLEKQHQHQHTLRAY